MDARADGPGDGDGGGDGPCDTAGRVDAVRLAGWRLGRALPCLRVWPGDIVAALPDQAAPIPAGVIRTRPAYRDALRPRRPATHAPAQPLPAPPAVPRPQCLARHPPP